MTRVDPRSAQELTPSQREWLRVRNYLRGHRHELGVAAAREYPDVATVAGSVLLTTSRWLPTRPLPLDQIRLDFAPDVPFGGMRGTEPVTEGVRPVRTDGTRYPCYSTALADLAAPAVFENRRTYRLLAADFRTGMPHLQFGRGRYFDGIDTGEAVGHEYAAGALLGRCDRPFRAAIGNPIDPARRPTNIAISAMTIRRDRRSGSARFLLHWRDPVKVGHAGGLYQVLPVGVFQPAGDHPWNERNDFSLWRCLLREYAEELLGEAELDGADAPIDYDAWPFAAGMDRARRDGSARAYCLGLGVDPLTLATDLLCAVVIDAPVFDELLGSSLVSDNAEGRLVSSPDASSDNAPGVAFSESEVKRLTHLEPLQAAGFAAIASAWLHREQLLS